MLIIYTLFPPPDGFSDSLDLGKLPLHLFISDLYDTDLTADVSSISPTA